MAGKCRNLRHKVMSLSALGAGALVFGAGRADATIISSGIIDQDVGFVSGIAVYVSPFLGPLNATFHFKTHHQTTRRTSFGSKITTVKRSIRAYGKSLFFEGNAAGTLTLFNTNAKWGAPVKPNAANELVGGRKWNNSGMNGVVWSLGNKSFPTTSSPNQYALFRFKTSTSPTKYDYGWIELSYSVSRTLNPLSYSPELVVDCWAYDDAGAIVVAGEEPPAAPEPGTLFQTGLAALALGAAGLRRWRKTRPSA